MDGSAGNRFSTDKREAIGLHSAKGGYEHCSGIKGAQFILFRTKILTICLQVSTRTKKIKWTTFKKISNPHQVLPNLNEEFNFLQGAFVRISLKSLGNCFRNVQKRHSH